MTRLSVCLLRLAGKPNLWNRLGGKCPSVCGRPSAPEPRGDGQRNQDVEHQIAHQVGEDEEGDERPAAMLEQAFPAEAAALVAQGAETG